jgi:2-hydroxycyclohexanecarboxyl-CoA dehydrogenase
MMTDVFDGDVILLGGSSGSVGRSAARLLLESGARVGLHYNSNAEHAHQMLDEFGPDRVLPLRGDLADRASARDVVGATLRAFGVINGFLTTVGTRLRLEPLVKITDDTVDRTIQVELVSVITTVQAAVAAMSAQGGGRIVIVGSDSGKVGTTGEAVSAACRGGIIALAKSVAREHARDGVLVNVICPGPTDSTLWDQFVSNDAFGASVGGAMARAIPLGRLGQPEEVAAAAVFLLSPAASFITGQAISVSGGLTMS